MQYSFKSTLVLVSLLAANPLHAQEASRAINLADLDLRSTEGQKTLHSRVKAAVKAVCGDNDTPDLAVKAAQARCRKTAASAADRQVAVAIADYRATSLAINAH